MTEGYGDGRPNRAAALGLRRAAASGNRRSPEARRFELPATVSKFEHTVVTRRARRIRPGGFLCGRSCGKGRPRVPLEAVLELRGKPCSGDGRGNWGWAAVEGGGEMLFAEVIGLW